MAQCVADYLYVLRLTNSTSYTRRFLAWLEQENPTLHKLMVAELGKLRTASRSRLSEGDPSVLWLKE